MSEMSEMKSTRHDGAGGRSSRPKRTAWAGLALLGAACVADPSEHQQSMSLSLDPLTLRSGEEDACSQLVLTFKEAPPTGETVTLTTTIGTLNPNGTTAADKRKLSLTTTSSTTMRATLCPGSVTGTGRITASAPGLEAVQSDEVTVTEPSVAALTLRATTFELHAPDQTATTLSIGVIPARPADDPTGIRIGLLACCEPSALSAQAGASQGCDDDLSVPAFVDTTGNAATATAVLTADGLAFTRASVDGGLRERDVTVFAFLPTSQPPTCAGLTSGGIGSPSPAKVVLRMTTRDPGAAASSTSSAVN